MDFDPSFDHSSKLFRLGQQLVHFGIARHLCGIVVHLIPLAATGIEIRDQVANFRPHRELKGLECRLVMPNSAHAIPGTGNHHLGQLEHRVVRRSESPVGGDLPNAGVLEIPLDDRPKVFNFLTARPVALYAPVVQQFLPAHSRFHIQTISFQLQHSSKNGGPPAISF